MDKVSDDKFNYVVYYKKNDGTYRLLDRKNVYTDLQRLPRVEKFKGYEMLKGYDASDF